MLGEVCYINVLIAIYWIYYVLLKFIGGGGVIKDVYVSEFISGFEGTLRNFYLWTELMFI